jgi:RNA polymerase sigma-70 factor (ECF subfamily)
MNMEMYHFFTEVADEIALSLKRFILDEKAYRLRTYRHKAYYSLDQNDGIEHSAVFISLFPEEIYERKVTNQEIYHWTHIPIHPHCSASQ